MNVFLNLQYYCEQRMSFQCDDHEGVLGKLLCHHLHPQWYCPWNDDLLQVYPKSNVCALFDLWGICIGSCVDALSYALYVCTYLIFTMGPCVIPWAGAQSNTVAVSPIFTRFISTIFRLKISIVTYNGFKVMQLFLYFRGSIWVFNCTCL